MSRSTGRRSPENDLEDLVPLLIDVQENLGSEASLASLARLYGYSPFHFQRFFSRAIGETPKRYVDRLRLERAAYKLAITADSVLEIALAVGFNSHETFTRAFRRAFRCTPRDYRQACSAAQLERLERNRGFRGEGCRLSDVEFVSLPPTTLLGMRRHGAYAECPVPFEEGDDLWSVVVDWAIQNGVSHRAVAITIPYDDPTVTPERQQRLDACIPIDGEAAVAAPIRRIEIAGGRYGAIDHSGPFSTIDQAYRGVADGIRRSSRYDFDEGPPIQIFHRVHVDDIPSANVTRVLFPVRPVG